ncbi:MAG: hypothetical protein QXJ53_02320 [Candidatus Bathyarchaeia archaeon]
MNRQLMLLAFGLIITIPFFQSSIFSRNYKPIPGLHVIKNLPSDMVAGATYEWMVSFVNPQSENGLMNLTLEIAEEHGIGFEEFTVEGTLESYDSPPKEHTYKTLKFTETSGGIFQSNQNPIDKRFNTITLKITLAPNLMPSKYTFTLTITIKHQRETTHLTIKN